MAYGQRAAHLDQKPLLPIVQVQGLVAWNSWVGTQ